MGKFGPKFSHLLTVRPERAVKILVQFSLLENEKISQNINLIINYLIFRTKVVHWQNRKSFGFLYNYLNFPREREF